MRTILTTLACCAALNLLGGSPSFSQPPSAEWQTISTENFRVHYPEPWEAWATRLASRLEAIREVVGEEVGFELEQPIDVVIADPEAQANGSAWPILGGPRTIFWTRPPGADSVLGNFNDWGELLAIHEIAHLVHLGRPSRNPWRQLTARVLPLGPLTRKGPRWLHEGYATVVEGRLSGSGRPHGDLRAAIIRRFAVAGRLPSYQALAADSQSYLGMSMAYLVGSAYLEWLDARVEPGSLPRLWRRMSARVDRNFDDSFRGVYGAPPRELYSRFVAEVTAQALESERSIREFGREGELWLDLPWSTGAPAVSPDGRRIAAIQRDRELPPRLMVWDLAEDPAMAERATQLATILERDPDDVAPIEAAMPASRRVVASLPAPVGSPISGGRWSSDSSQLLFTRFDRDHEGVRHGDLFLWSVEGGGVRRITHGGDVSDGDVAHTPAGSSPWAVAVQARYGATGLVRVDLTDGNIEEITAASVERVVDRPRLSPDARQLAYLEHSLGRWSVMLRDLDSGAVDTVAVPENGRPVDLAWSASGEHLYAVVGRGGQIDIEALPIGADALWHQVTRAVGPVAAPAPSPDGETLFFLALDPNGLDIIKLPLDAATEQLPPLELDLAAPPVVPPAPAQVSTLAEGEVSAPRPYGLGRVEWTPLFGGAANNEGGPFELGVRAGDLLGRWNGLAVVSVGDEIGPRGAALAASLRRFPLELGLHAFSYEQERSSEDLAGTPNFELERRGLELRLGRALVLGPDTFGPGRLEVAAGLVVLDDEVATGVSVDSTFAFAELDVARWWGGGRWRVRPRAGVALRREIAGDEAPDLRRYRLELRTEYGRHSLDLGWVRHDSNGDNNGEGEVWSGVSLGGASSSLIPRSLEIGWSPNPALPLATLVGERLESQYLRLKPAGFPVELFTERHRVDSGSWLRLAGIEWRLDVAPMPVVRLPALELRLGAAYVLDDNSATTVSSPLADSTRWWLGLVYRP